MSTGSACSSSAGSMGCCCCSPPTITSRRRAHPQARRPLRADRPRSTTWARLRLGAVRPPWRRARRGRPPRGLGPHHIGLAAGPRHVRPGREHAAGIVDAAEELGIRMSRSRRAVQRPSRGRAPTTRLLALADPPTAIVTGSHDITLGVLRRAGAGTAGPRGSLADHERRLLRPSASSTPRWRRSLTARVARRARRTSVAADARRGSPPITNSSRRSSTLAGAAQRAAAHAAPR